jgi:hypothetical protein
MKVEDITWTMRDKTKIRLGDMTHRHLANTIRMVKRDITRHEREIDAAASYVGGDMAMMAAEQSADSAVRKADNARMWLTALMAEKKRRANLSTVDDAIAIMQEAA